MLKVLSFLGVAALLIVTSWLFAESMFNANLPVLVWLMISGGIGMVLAWFTFGRNV